MTAPQDRPRPRRSERRQSLLDQAREAFARAGYSATTTAALAADAGVSEAAFARHYPAKADLFRDLLDDLLASTLAAWGDDVRELDDPHARLVALGDRFAGHLDLHPVAWRAVARALAEADPDALALVAAFAGRWEDFLADLIGHGQGTGVFRRSLDPRVGAWQLMHAALGCALTRPLAVPAHGDGYAARAMACAIQCLLKTDV